MKTVPLSKCSTISMVNGGEKTHPKIVHEGKVKEWVGFGWIVLHDASDLDRERYPTAV